MKFLLALAIVVIVAALLAHFALYVSAHYMQIAALIR